MLRKSKIYFPQDWKTFIKFENKIAELEKRIEVLEDKLKPKEKEIICSALPSNEDIADFHNCMATIDEIEKQEEDFDIT